jgi:hypothetical protein
MKPRKLGSGVKIMLRQTSTPGNEGHVRMGKSFVGPRTGLNTLSEKKIRNFAWNLTTAVELSVASLYHIVSQTKHLTPWSRVFLRS